MKQILLVAWMLLVSFSNLNAQKELREAKVTYSIFVSDSGTETSMIKNALGKEWVVYFKDSSSRTEMQTTMGTQVAIKNSKTGESYVLMEIMGEKYALKMTDED